MGHPEQSILLAMADHAHDDGTHVFPSIAYLSWKTGYSERQVQRIGKDLRKRGVLIPISQPPGCAVEYRIDLKRLPEKLPYRKKDRRGDVLSPPAQESNGVTNPIQGVTSTTLGGDIAMSDQSSVEPSLESPVEPKGSIQPNGKTGRKRKAGVRLTKPLVIFRGVTGHLPAEPLREDVTKLIGDSPDIPRMSACYKTWLGRGYNKYAMDWLFDWYSNNSIPERNGNRQHGRNEKPEGSSTESKRSVLRKPLSE